MRLGYSQSLGWSWLSGQPPRHGHGKGEFCSVRVEDQTHHCWTAPSKTRTFFQAVASWFCCAVVLSFTD